jgi:toluene monooxygenase system protein D
MSRGGEVNNRESPRHAVGPVVQATPLGRAIVAAIESSNDDIDIRDEGAYLRVIAYGSCRVTRAAVEAEFGQPIRLPGDLEVIMSSFAGLVSVNENGAVWWRAPDPYPGLSS